MVNNVRVNVRVNVNHRRDFHPLVDHVTNLRNFTKGEICEFFNVSIFTLFNI